MNPFTRWGEVARREFMSGLRRPAYWILFAILALMAWGLSEGSVTISTGESIAGGERPHITSVFNQSMIQGVVLMVIGAWFLAIASGLVVIRDIELQVVEVFNSTRLTPREYVWGKFSGAVAVFLCIWALYLCLAVGFNHIVEGGSDAEHIGPFAIGNYLLPTMLFGLPQILFFAGGAFFIGTWTRRPILVFLFPVATLLVTLSVLTSWSPSWLSPEANRALMLIDPSGFRWVNETFLKVDRGVDFYNTAPLGPDPGFVISRVVFAVLGLCAVAGAAVSYGRRVQSGDEGSRFMRLFRRPRAVTEETRPPAEPTVQDLAMFTRPPGFWKGAAVIARSEIRDLLVRPGMYLFVPLILVQTISSTWLAVGPFDSRILLTSGAVATNQLNTLNLLLCFLLLFYTVESLQKERSRRLHEIYGAAPVGTGAILLGKAMGNSVMASFVLVAALLADAGIILYQQLAEASPVSFELFPFVAAWGAVLLPTFLFWAALVTALFSLFRNRYVVYAAGMALIIYTVFSVETGSSLDWPVNWLGWGVLNWSDMGAFTLHGYPLLLNRLLYLSLVPLLVALSVRWFARRDFDATGILNRIRPKPLLLGGLRLLPLAVPAIVLASILSIGGESGYEGSSADDWADDYWNRNIATWDGFEMPSVSHVDLDLDIEPAERSVAVEGAYTFYNHRDYAYGKLPLTAGQWNGIEWTLAGESYEPEDRASLYVFTLREPLAPGDSVTIGFSYDLEVLGGMSKGPGGAGQFVLESGIVLNGFAPTFAPLPGYNPAIGSEDFEPRSYEDDFYEGETEPLIGWPGMPFTVRTRITLPEDFTANAVGQLVSDEVADGRRTVVWETDHPVAMFNVVAGKYAVSEGDGTAIYYHPKHDYNIDEMTAALDAARKYYSEWFHPFPWTLLKISEYPAYARYAQGFPTNIVFSEGIGFLTKSDPRSHAAFMVVAHEAAHQWWGNLLGPGRGPGGNILSEGMAHYATTLLHEQVYGDRYRMEFGKRIEESYGDGRYVDSERPMVKTDGGRAGDQTVTYDKGGWVMWMLQQEMGRENTLAGLRAFIAEFNPDPDYPVIQDMLAVLRDFAPDTAAFDDFAAQWFYDVVVPEYQFSDVTRMREGDEWIVRGTVENVGTGRMRVEVAATAGERWSDEGEDGSRSVVARDYRDARTEVVLGAGEVAGFMIRAAFEPERVVIDPDVMVLQLRRDAAEHRFER